MIKELKTRPPCVVCGTVVAEMWWKCCPLHCADNGRDFVCATCVLQLHGICIMPKCDKFGVEAVHLKFALIDNEGYRLIEDKSRQVFLCEDHKGEIVLLEPQY